MFDVDGMDLLASLRYIIFCQKITSAKSFVARERLPHTASTTKFHCLRTYYQIMVIGMDGRKKVELMSLTGVIETGGQ